MAKEDKHDRFERVVTKRVNTILNELRKLGNCSRRANYSYTDGEVSKIFATLGSRLQEIHKMFEEPRKGFSLQKQRSEDGPIEIFIEDLVPEVQQEVLEAMGLKTPEEGNLDVCPLFTLEIDND